MATDGRQVEDLPEEEKLRELRLRYTGALKVMVENELRLAAARLMAAYPLATQDAFVDMAREAYRTVAGDVFMAARDAREVIPVSAKE